MKLKTLSPLQKSVLFARGNLQLILKDHLKSDIVLNVLQHEVTKEKHIKDDQYYIIYRRIEEKIVCLAESKTYIQASFIDHGNIDCLETKSNKEGANQPRILLQKFVDNTIKGGIGGLLEALNLPITFALLSFDFKDLSKMTHKEKASDNDYGLKRKYSLENPYVKCIIEESFPLDLFIN